MLTLNKALCSWHMPPPQTRRPSSHPSLSWTCRRVLALSTLRPFTTKPTSRPKVARERLSACVCVGVRLDKWRGGWSPESEARVDKKPPAHYLLPCSCFLISSRSLSAVRHCVKPIRFSLTLQELMSLFPCFYSVLQNAHIHGTHGAALF